jgi:hypothetical protein
MSDYTACSNTTCPDRGECYRYRLVYHPNWQSFSQFKPDPAIGGCRNFLKVEEGDRLVSEGEADARLGAK